eukprot:TRINITY_DN3838_c0_g1_i3.p1 TRINITY_DN3838_c0_g1~~TRINITY_DN3838_c0_g1_i3.p1  ORF type:complete len:424 (-),score=16.44 TRINITY_DN3838_c0_g1_i3:195-1466(-)
MCIRDSTQMTEQGPVDHEKGIENFGGEEVYLEMVQQFEVLTFDETVKKVYTSLKENNWYEVRNGAHQLKGASGYIGATIFSAACWELHKAVDSFWADGGGKQGDCEPKHYSNIVARYLDFMLQAKILKAYLAKYLKKPPELSDIESYYREFANSKEVEQPKEAVIEERGKESVDPASVALVPKPTTEEPKSGPPDNGKEGSTNNTNPNNNNSQGPVMEPKGKEEPCKCCMIFQDIKVGALMRILTCFAFWLTIKLRGTHLKKEGFSVSFGVKCLSLFVNIINGKRSKVQIMEDLQNNNEKDKERMKAKRCTRIPEERETDRYTHTYTHTYMHSPNTSTPHTPHIPYTHLFFWTIHIYIIIINCCNIPHFKYYHKQKTWVLNRERAASSFEGISKEMGVQDRPSLCKFTYFFPLLFFVPRKKTS